VAGRGLLWCAVRQFRAASCRCRGIADELVFLLELLEAFAQVFATTAFFDQVFASMILMTAWAAEQLTGFASERREGDAGILSATSGVAIVRPMGVRRQPWLVRIPA
jgi:hypothetical protein